MYYAVYNVPCGMQDDILTQIVAIEYLRYLADTHAGLTHLFTSSEGVFAWLVTIAHGSFASDDTGTYHYHSFLSHSLTIYSLTLQGVLRVMAMVAVVEVQGQWRMIPC